jgi:hypothetical protein
MRVLFSAGVLYRTSFFNIQWGYRDFEIEIRKTTSPEQSPGTTIDGVDVRMGVGRLIEALEHDLVIGLGSAVSISYAEEMIQKARNQKH